MLYPSHVACMYLCTAGQRGAGLGSDEQEIVYMSYVVIEVATNKIIGVQQYLVRPTVADVNENILTADLLAETSLTEQAVLQAGRPLQAVVQQFDSYVRSLQLDPDLPHFRLVTDGQLPLRQCLHPEACTKGIELPAYYCRFHDLRKELTRFILSRATSEDLSRALVPLPAPGSQIPDLPADALAPPTCIQDMLDQLHLESYVENDFYVRESRDMVSILQRLISEGHRFEVPETVNLILEPGICSKDDEIDGSCIVRARGLPWQSSDQDIARFFRGLNVAKGGVALCLSPQGRRNGEALVRFVSQEHRDMALKRHKHHIGPRYIEVYRANGEDFLSVAGGASNEAQAFLSRGAQVIVRMRGLPYDCTAAQVLEFFENGESPCTVLDGSEGVLFVRKPDGRATGDAFVLFSEESDSAKALSRHRELIGARYIELFRSTTAEVQQVLNRSMDPKTYEPPAPPLIAQLPQVPLLPQHVITSGTLKDCIRLRGLPYEAQVEHILHFLEDFAKNIVYQGVHMVYNAQGQPSGEAFIQMDSEQSAFMCAQQKHHRNMCYGKKQRYIEVFQCSGEDMNLVLTGGLPTPTSPVKPGGLLSPGMLLPNPSNSTNAVTMPLPPTNVPPPLPPPVNNHLISHNPMSTSMSLGQQLGLVQTPVSLAQTITSMPPPSAQKLIPPPSINLSWENPALFAQQQAQMIAQQSLIARQNAQSEHMLLAQIAAHNLNMAVLAQNGAHAQLPPSNMHHLQVHNPNIGLIQHPSMPSFNHLIQQGAFHPNPYFLMQQRLPMLRSGVQLSLPPPGAYGAQPMKRSYEHAFPGEITNQGLLKRQYPSLTQAPSVGNPYAAFYPNV